MRDAEAQLAGRQTFGLAGCAIRLLFADGAKRDEVESALAVAVVGDALQNGGGLLFYRFVGQFGNGVVFILD